MELLAVDLPKSHRIILAGDIHYGNKAYSESRLMRLVDRVGSERSTFLLLTGDLVEAKLSDHKHWDKDVHDPHLTPLVQAERIADILKPIRKKIIAVMEGNHEHTLWRWGDITRMICDRIDVRYGGFSCKLSVRNGRRQLFKHYATHGTIRLKSTADDQVRKVSNLKLAVKRYLKGLAGDCATMSVSHCHQLYIQGPEAITYIVDDGEELHARKQQTQQSGEWIDYNLRWYCSTGGFLRTQMVNVTTYSERAGYEPCDLAWAEIATDGGKLMGIFEDRATH